MNTRHAFAVVALAAAAGCNNGLAPLEGDLYVLQSIAGVSLPAPYVLNSIEDVRVVADTIALRSNGTGVRRTVYTGIPDPKDLRRHEAELTFTRTANQINIFYVCRDTGDCIAGPHLAGTITDGGITIDQSTIHSLQPYVYGRIFGLD